MSKNPPYNVLCGEGDIASAQRQLALAPFDPRVLAFLADVSAALLHSKEAKPYPDVITFAFFCRKAHLEQMEREHAAPHRLGRGLVFHIAPSNVPINFAYSLVAALLSGNASIVKASSQDFIQTRLVCAAMEALLSGPHSFLRPYVNVVTYPRDRQDITEALSAACDVRVIWGGDETVRRVREAPLSPHAFDVTFADRYSLLCVNPEAVLAMDEQALAAMAQGFYNDTFLTDQNACTAPRLVYWVVGDCDPRDTAAAKERFWQAVHAYAAPRYPIQPVIAVDKLTALYRAAIQLPGAKRVPMGGNLIARVQLAELTEDVLDIRCPGGFFVEYDGADLNPLRAIACRRVQTLSYMEIRPEELQAFVLSHGLRGVDRIVPLGKTLDFSLTWDGYDLVQTLSRRVQSL